MISPVPVILEFCETVPCWDHKGLVRGALTAHSAVEVRQVSLSGTSHHCHSCVIRGVWRALGTAEPR